MKCLYVYMVAATSMALITSIVILRWLGWVLRFL